MKTIILLGVTFFLLSCSSEQASDAPAAGQPSDTVAVAVEAGPEPTVGDIGQAADSADAMMLNGTLIVPAKNNITITLPMGGAVASFAHLPGDYIRKGETVVVLENTEFIDLQQTYLDASAQSDFLEAEFNRQQALSAQDATSRKRLQQSKADYLSMKSRKDAAAARLKILGVSPETLAAKGIVARLEVKAPQSGYVSEVMVNKGKYVAAGEPICMIIDKQQILLNLIAYEKDLKDIVSGQELEFRVNGMSDRTFTAVVSAIDQRVDPVNRSVKVYAKATSTHPDFRPGMYVVARVKQ